MTAEGAVAVAEIRMSPGWQRWANLTLLGRHWSDWLQLVSLAAAAAALAVAAAWGDQEACLTALAGLLVGYALVRYVFARSDWRFLVSLFVTAFCLRVVLSIGLHWLLIASGRGGFLLMDDRAYDKLGWTLARVWMGIFPGIRDSDEYLMMNYTYLVSGIYFVLGHNLLAAKMLNVLFGALTPVVVYAIGTELWDRRVARISALLMAFFPSLLIWSAINLKDILAVLLVELAILGALIYARRHVWWALVVALLGLLAMENMRQFVYLILGWLMPAAFLLADRSTWKRKLILFAPLLLGVLLTFQITHNQKFGLNWLSVQALTEAEWKRWFEANRADSALELDFDKPLKSQRDLVGLRSIAYLPRGIYYVLMAPLPWEARSTNSRAAIPEMLVWYVLLLAAIPGLTTSLKARWRDLFLPLGLSAGWIVALALTEGNAGNIFRHRAQFMPYILLLSAVGLVWLWGRYGLKAAGKSVLQPGTAPARGGEAVSL